MFADTSGLFALTVRRDDNHVAALHIRSRLIATSRPLFTTNFVLAELHALVLARVDHRFARRVLYGLLSSDLAVARVSAEDEHRALDVLGKYDDKAFSFTDAMSFAVMDRVGTRTAFSFDHHFTQYGLTLLTPDR
ncbi:MAG: PIN domain-containing protein [Thermomicrobiales bacterium]|nr:PIN domain-containing protein [Thermomicrobiales bacterium]